MLVRPGDGVRLDLLAGLRQQQCVAEEPVGAAAGPDRESAVRALHERRPGIAVRQRAHDATGDGGGRRVRSELPRVRGRMRACRLPDDQHESGERQQRRQPQHRDLARDPGTGGPTAEYCAHIHLQQDRQRTITRESQTDGSDAGGYASRKARTPGSVSESTMRSASPSSARRMRRRDADRPHAAGLRRPQPGRRVLDHDAATRLHADAACGDEEPLGVGLAPRRVLLRDERLEPATRSPAHRRSSPGSRAAST